VIWLYDRVAQRYDHIKNLNYVHESRFIGLPLSEALADVDAPKVLDVATAQARAVGVAARAGFSGDAGWRGSLGPDAGARPSGPAGTDGA
jgi:hypothetical protein